MKVANKRFIKFILTFGFTCLSFCVASRGVMSQEAPAKDESQTKSRYIEIKKDGRLYVFTSSARESAFEKSAELGKSIIKIGYGPHGETVVFDSEEAVIEYESRRVKDILGKANIKAYREFEMNGRLYVFTSPARKADFDKSGECGKAIIKIGYGENGNTVVFDSEEAVTEYDKRHVKK